MAVISESIRTIDLGYEQMMIFDGGRGTRMRVLYGATWLTEEGEPGDVVVRSGSERQLRAGRTLIEALEPTRLQLVERAGSSSAAMSAWLGRWLRGALRQRARQQFGPAAAEASR